MKHELRFTETNSSDDSKGKTWGLDGDLFWFIAGGAFAAVAILLVCFSALRMSFFLALSLAVVPLILSAIYVFVFRQGKPRGYDLDCLDYWLNGPGFRPVMQRPPEHPLCLTKRPMDTSSMT